ncbi:MAG TPA: ethanolamine utilization microcompartment protein EutS [Chloroflexaceae bacterium]|nr:ethanolamine utilization microcompartment protein EutS [Chloroflexaceae bacterium]
MSTQHHEPDEISARIIQEYVPGRQVTIAHIIANPDGALCEKVGLDDADAIGMLTLTPGESTIIAGDLALKAADVRIGFLDRFSGTLVVTGRLTSVQVAIEAANSGMEAILGFHPARITRS